MTLRVAFVVPDLQRPSGWRSFSVGAIRSLQEYAGIHPVVFTSREDAISARRLLPACDLVIVPRTQFMGLRNPLTWPEMALTFWHIKNRQFPQVDLVHSLEAYPTGLVGSWLAWKLGKCHLITACGTYGVVWHNSVFDKLLYKQVLRRAWGMCPISHGTASLVQRYFGKALANVRVQPILPGNDYYKTVSRSESFHRQFSVTPTIISVGAVKLRKGYHISLAAFAKVKEQLPSARYFIVGSFDQNSYYYDQLRQFIAEHQLRDVEFLGIVSEEKLQQYYRQASVFLLTPQQQGLYFEGFGLVYLEAGAYGLPVVGTRTGGVPDAVKDGVTGFLAEPHDVDCIANALLRLLTDVDLARRMGQANREWAETLTWERFAAEQYAVYQKALAQSNNAGVA
jgi:glycosyltransferase involved in cell wall biosynthesis